MIPRIHRGLIGNFCLARHLGGPARPSGPRVGCPGIPFDLIPLIPGAPKPTGSCDDPDHLPRRRSKMHTREQLNDALEI